MTKDNHPDVSNSTTTTTTTETSKTNGKSSVPIIVRAKRQIDEKLLIAATEGDIAYLESVRRCNPEAWKGSDNHPQDDNSDVTKMLREAVCVSGCTLLHWAAGSNQVGVLEYLLSPLDHDPENPAKEEGNQSLRLGTSSAIFCNDGENSVRAVDLPVTKCKKSLGRTPLHYACRNGCLEAVRWLVLVGGASIGVKARQGVTPFQLAVWQNRLEICVFLAQAAAMEAKDSGQPAQFDPANDFNDFGCGAVHWLGIAPESRANCHRADGNNNDDSWYNDGRDLLPLARWLASFPGIDFAVRQRQNHTVLHKASWGGHLALVKYLHQEHDMWDDVVDDAGNYAASLADMAHTPKHAQIATYLRHHCSRKRAESFAILGLKGESAPGKDVIRRAYLAKARQLHPDRCVAKMTSGKTNNDLKAGTIGNAIVGYNDDDKRTSSTTTSFDALHKAYLHLTEEGGVGDQSNPAHSLNLMLRYVNSSDNGVTNESEKTAKGGDKNSTGEDDSFFKARLVAVLLEYGDKGIDLSNVKKKWKQVWPEVPFPSQQQKTCKNDSNNPRKQQQGRKIPMAQFLMQRAGDVIRFERHGDRKRRVLVLLKNNSSKVSVLRSGIVATGTATPEVEERQ